MINSMYECIDEIQWAFYVLNDVFLLFFMGGRIFLATKQFIRQIGIIQLKFFGRKFDFLVELGSFEVI